ncbi:Vesicle-mediated ER to Golgi transport protein [Polyrhizophydium stewartii]|uniref:Vesicle-mediated ER to Golgi transport protein n=1 Tax=Polyrhizophydium stewartii TaxID=2732419 RepID=A0ABR4MZA8_9FUNG
MQSLFSALRGDKTPQQSPQEIIDKLCDRVQNSSLLEDRRSAVQGLRGMSREWRADVGNKAMDALINVLKSDRMDAEIIKLTLETLNILCSKSSQQTDNDPGIALTQAYVKDPSNVTLLLDILSELDFYVRFDTVQLLTTLLSNAGSVLQDCVLTSPMGVSRLIDLLDDRREIIRNGKSATVCTVRRWRASLTSDRAEGLLLLIALTHSNADIQKIIAFENAFERLLAIILDEGATDGGIIVQDCLQLMQNLLRYNVSNQNLFRETSCIKQLGRLLVSKVLSQDQQGAVDLPLTHERTEWTDQKIANVNSVLELIRILVAPKNANTAVNQTALGAAGIVVPLFQLGMAIHVPSRVRAPALFTVADTVRGHAANQDALGKCVITVVTRPEHTGLPNQKQPPGFPRPSILSLILVAFGREEFAIRAAAAYTFQAFVFKNPDGQLALVSTLVPPPPDNPNTVAKDAPASPGSLLVGALLDLDESRKDPFRSWFAAAMLMHLLRDNLAAKELAVSIKFEEGEEHISLLHKCMFSLLYANREGVHLRVQIGLWSLLAVWLYDCHKAVREFLNEGSNMQFLVEQVNQSSGIDPVVQGLAAFIIGLCYEFNDDSEPVFSRNNVQALVISRIGADVFQSRLERLRESKALNSALLHIVRKDEVIDPKNGPEIYFDFLFVEFFKMNYDALVRSVTTVQPKDAPSPHRAGAAGSVSGSTGGLASTAAQAAEINKHKAAAQALQRTVDDQDVAIAHLHGQVQALEQRLAQVAEHERQIAQLSALVESLQAQLRDEVEKRESIEREQEDLLVCLAEQDMENAELKKRLRAHGEVFADDDDEDGGGAP